MRGKPTPEELAELSRLHSELRDLRTIHRYRREKLFAPIVEATANVNKQLAKEFEKPIEDAKSKILRLRAAIGIRRFPESLEWKFTENWPKK